MGQPRAGYDAAMQAGYAQQYENLWNGHWWWRARKRFVTRWLGRVAQMDASGLAPSVRAGPRRILDVGCGNGLFFPELLRFGDVRGIESDAGLVAPDGPYRDRIDIRPFNPADPPPAGAPFDWLLMLDVLEHLRDDAAAASHVRRILAPGGLFLLTVPALESLWSAHDDANLHFRRYTRSRLRRLLRSAGFEILAIRYFFGWTVAPMLLRRFLAPGQGRKSPATRGIPAAAQANYRVGIPAPRVNTAMYALSCMEQSTLGRFGLPLGSSLIALARSPGPQ